MYFKEPIFEYLLLIIIFYVIALTCIKPAGGQGNKIYSVYLLICYHFELHK